MELNADFGQRAAVHATAAAWHPSPTPGVQRLMLDRIGDEVARATSIVRYARDSSFPTHVHGGGEEVFVLEGVFSDEHGDYPPGWYLRNPPQSHHAPGSKQGCTIWVKLWQFDPDDRAHVCIDSNKIDAVPDTGRPGVTVTPLYRDAREHVRLEHWLPGIDVTPQTNGGIEFFVLEGDFAEGRESFRRHSWLRLPHGATTTLRSGATGARVLVKSGHLTAAQSFRGELP